MSRSVARTCSCAWSATALVRRLARQRGCCGRARRHRGAWGGPPENHAAREGMVGGQPAHALHRVAAGMGNPAGPDADRLRANARPGAQAGRCGPSPLLAAPMEWRPSRGVVWRAALARRRPLGRHARLRRRGRAVANRTSSDGLASAGRRPVGRADDCAGRVWREPRMGDPGVRHRSRGDHVCHRCARRAAPGGLVSTDDGGVANSGVVRGVSSAGGARVPVGSFFRGALDETSDRNPIRRRSHAAPAGPQRSPAGGASRDRRDAVVVPIRVGGVSRRGCRRGRRPAPAGHEHGQRVCDLAPDRSGTRSAHQRHRAVRLRRRARQPLRAQFS